MAGSFGGEIKLKGESEYRRALSNISSNLQKLGSELNLATTSFNNNGKQVKDLIPINNALKNKIEEQRKTITLGQNAINELTKKQQENKTNLSDLSLKYSSAKEKLEQMKNSTTSTTSEIKKQESEVIRLKSEMEKSQKAFDVTEKSINNYAIKVNKSKEEISNLDAQLNKNTTILNKAGKSTKNMSKSVDEFSKSSEQAGKSTIKLGSLIKANLISSAMISGIKGMASAVVEVGKKLFEVGKAAIASYAEYEQLVGGVQTLFKGSAKEIENYANNAYKTAGMSANQYMDTVTSFSASLIQSLGGDTSKAAKTADMAITDMSDNANKMGTSMESIKNAYQGFAKQNYTMLDNLKLGYGGTKSEMQRLLKDAQKFSGVKYDINNLNDVYNAIHAIQTKLDITGTTAKEAASTISGSINATKSAWQNLLTGIADENADFGKLVSNFVDSIINVSKNLLPRIKQVIQGLSKLLMEFAHKLLPKLIEIAGEIIESLVKGIVDNLPSILSTINNLITTLLSKLIDMLPKIIEIGIKLIISLIEGIAKSLPTLIPQMIKAIVTMVTALLDNIDKLIDAGIELILGLAEGLINAIPDLVDKIPIIIEKLIIAIINNFPKIVMAGVNLIFKLSEGLIKAIPHLLGATIKIIAVFFKGIIDSMAKTFKLGVDLVVRLKDGLVSGIKTIVNVGVDLVKGLWNGINNAKDWVLNKIKGFGKSILNGIKSFFGIKSPSRVFRDEIGSNLAKGIGIGFEQEMNNVTNDIQDSLPTEFDLTSKVNMNNKVNGSNNFLNNPNNMIESFQKALEGMAIKFDSEKMGELVIKKVEEVVF